MAVDQELEGSVAGSDVGTLHLGVQGNYHGTLRTEGWVVQGGSRNRGQDSLEVGSKEKVGQGGSNN